MAPRPESDYLREMLAACDRVASRLYEISKEAFLRDDTLQDAVIYRLAVIGEAVTRVTPATQARYSDVPWNRIKWFRNFVIHEYFAVDVESIWDTATVEAPILREQIAAILAAEFPEEGS